MSRVTLDQQRAKHAWDEIQRILQTRKEKTKEIFRHAKKLPVRILVSGLGQAIAFAQTKKETDELIISLDGWIRIRLKYGVNDKLLEKIISGDSAFLRRATEESLLYLQWFNRLAEGASKNG